MTIVTSEPSAMTSRVAQISQGGKRSTNPVMVSVSPVANGTPRGPRQAGPFGPGTGRDGESFEIDDPLDGNVDRHRFRAARTSAEAEPDRDRE